MPTPNASQPPADSPLPVPGTGPGSESGTPPGDEHGAGEGTQADAAATGGSEDGGDWMAERILPKPPHVG